jgi:hypothetical protein
MNDYALLSTFACCSRATESKKNAFSLQLHFHLNEIFSLDFHEMTFDFFRSLLFPTSFHIIDDDDKASDEIYADKIEEKHLSSLVCFEFI